jgi:hypothetical protein
MSIRTSDATVGAPIVLSANCSKSFGGYGVDAWSTG